MPDVVAMVNALSLLAPCEVPAVGKIRIGHQYQDGGYVLGNRFRSGQIVYSYGISGDVTFDRDLAERGLQIFMYDHTITTLPEEHKNFHFFREGISSKDDPQSSLFKLSTHISRNGHTDNDMVLKMDVEGAEWSVLESIEVSVLEKFQQIVLEFHDLNKIEDSEFQEKFILGLAKICSLFHLIHVHGNNNVPLMNVAGLQIAPVLEVSFIKKELGTAYPWRTVIPSELDAPNCSEADFVLNFYPFTPTSLPQNEYRQKYIEALQRANFYFERLSEKIDRRGENIALSGVCSQSSLSVWSVAPDEANRALRSVKDGRYAFHTDEEFGPWWQIDFEKTVCFDEIICFNRLDACSHRAANMHIEISDDRVNWDTIHRNVKDFGGIGGEPLRVLHPRTSTRYLRVRLPSITALHLDGIEIYDWQSA